MAVAIDDIPLELLWLTRESMRRTRYFQMSSSVLEYSLGSSYLCCVNQFFISHFHHRDGGTLASNHQADLYPSDLAHPWL